MFLFVLLNFVLNGRFVIFYPFILCIEE